MTVEVHGRRRPSAVRPPREMGPARLEAFSDGVMAVILAIMVLALRLPSGDDLAARSGTLYLSVS